MPRVLILFARTGSVWIGNVERWIKFDRTAQRTYPFAVSHSIVTDGSRSNGCGRLDLKLAALRWLPAAESSIDDGAGDTGSERERGHAHRVRKIVGKLEVVSSYRGAYWSELDCSPELLRAAGLSGCRRWRRCGSPRDKMMTRLDSQGQGEVVCMNER